MTDQDQKPLSRRDLLKACAGITIASPWAAQKSEQKVTPAPGRGEGKRVREYSAIRGFNYQPSYAANGLDIWRRFDAATIEKEVAQGKKYFPRINTLRLWLAWDAFLAEPKAFAAHFEKMLAILHGFELRAIVTIFNAWHSIPDFGGVSSPQLGTWRKFRPAIDGPFLRYIQAIVGEHSDDPRVLLWDLCNEPPKEETYLQWLKWVYENCKAVGAKAPICVGNMPNLDIMKATEHISDVLTWHPYWAWDTWRKKRSDYIKFMDDSVAYAQSVDKPLLASECCWGAADNKKRAEVIEFELSELKKRGIGWTAHLLHYSLVADAHRCAWSYTAAGYMAFIEADGSLREDHSIFNKF